MNKPNVDQYLFDKNTLSPQMIGDDDRRNSRLTSYQNKRRVQMNREELSEIYAKLRE